MKKLTDPYAGFAGIYDQVMCSVDYEGWADYVEQLLGLFAKEPRSIVDLACGTGSSTFPFARRGYRVTGIDLSPAMLALARKKSALKGLDVDFLEMDLCALELPDRYDLALLFQDGLNYILSEGLLVQSLSRVHAALNTGALFIFDLTRPRLRSEGGNGSLCLVDQDDFTLAWETTFCSETALWSVLLTGFCRTGSGLFEKFQEQHWEKDYEPELIFSLLEKTGFKLRGLYPSFSLDTLSGSDQKLTFVAEKGQ